MHTLLLFFLLLPGAAPASLHKCIGADGVASYQSLPCAPGQRTAWTRRPEPPAALPPRIAAPAPAAPAVRSAPAVRHPAARKVPDPSANRCASVRRAADLTRDRLWNRLSFRQRSDLDAKVALACAPR